jgi:hypothetical protein
VATAKYLINNSISTIMALVLPTLTAFTSSRLTAILTAKTQADFTSAFDALFASNVNVIYNGKQLSREQYQAQLLSQSSAALEEQGASVSVQGQLEVPGDKGQIVSTKIHFDFYSPTEGMRSLGLSVYFTLPLLTRSSLSLELLRRAK